MSVTSHPVCAAAENLSAHAAFLGWHAGWLCAYARDEAARTYLDLVAGQQPVGGDDFTPARRQIWEKAGIKISTDVHDAMSPIEDPGFVAMAQVFGIEVFLRHLSDLLRTSCRGGRA